MEYKVAPKLPRMPVKLPSQVFDARYHPNVEGKVAVATIAGDVYLISDRSLVASYEKHHKGAPVRRVRFDRDGRMVTIAKTIKIHDLEAQPSTTQILKRNDGNKDTFYSVMPMGGSLICAGDDSGKLYVWDTREPARPVFTSHDCEQYISDIDGRYESRKIVCTSGEGTLTAYDLRANKMIEPQSELFEAGFQCVKMVDVNKKVVVGGEDGAIYVFNQGEWAHTSGKFALSDDTQNRGKCSIECIEMIPDSSEFVVACSDGRIRSLSLWPHQVLSETVVSLKDSLETMHVSPSAQELVVGYDRFVNFVTYEEKEETESDEDEETGVMEEEDGEEEERKEMEMKKAKKEKGDGREKKRVDAKDDEGADVKKVKVETEDYLNVF